METLQAPTTRVCIEAQEAVEKWGDVSDWHHAIGTGPFILKDFVSGNSATLIKILITGDMMNDILRINCPISINSNF